MLELLVSLLIIMHFIVKLHFTMLYTYNKNKIIIVYINSVYKLYTIVNIIVIYIIHKPVF